MTLLQPVVNNEVTVIGIGAVVKDDSKSKHQQRRHRYRNKNRRNNNNNNNGKDDDGYNKKPESSSDDSTCTTVSSSSSSSSSSSVEGGNSSSADLLPKKGAASTTKTNNNNNTKGKKDRRRRNRGGGGERRKKQQKQKKQGSVAKDQVVEEELSEEERSQYVALDCEMVGVAINGRYGRKEISSVARVTLVGWDGNIIMDEFIKQTEEVIDYRTFVSGITENDLSSDAATTLLTLGECTSKVTQIIDGKILVGHALRNDLKVLNISHPWYMTRDTAKYEPFQQVRFDDGVLWPRKLKDLVKQKLDRDIQVMGVPHCPIEDAMAALDLYKSARKKWEKAMDYKINKTKEIQQSLVSS